jgi:hypothetical protein
MKTLLIFYFLGSKRAAYRENGPKFEKKMSWYLVGVSALQQKFCLYIPFLGIAWPQPQFPHLCVCERFIYSQDRSTYFLKQKRQTHRGNI